MLQPFNESELTDGITLVAFKAPWCAPCKVLTPVLEELHEEGYNIRVVDIDEQSELAVKYRIRSVPTLITFEGQDVKKIVAGTKTKTELLKEFI